LAGPTSSNPGWFFSYGRDDFPLSLFCCSVTRAVVNLHYLGTLLMDILIAEDDFISRKLLVNILEELGHVVTVASNGEEAWNAYRAQPCRLVITDWLMPDMDGLELVRKIREKDLSDYTYVILLTANIGQRENYFKAMNKGADDFLAKPPGTGDPSQGGGTNPEGQLPYSLTGERPDNLRIHQENQFSRRGLADNRRVHAQAPRADGFPRHRAGVLRNPYQAPVGETEIKGQGRGNFLIP
jgi:CheY-like chemotaxis protein